MERTSVRYPISSKYLLDPKSMRHKPTIAFTLFLLAGTIFYLLFLYISKGKKEGVIQTTGIVEGIEVNLSSKVSGRIAEICCRESDTVREGQVVFRLESEDIQASVRQAAAGVEKAKAAVRVSESAIKNARASIESAEADLEKDKVRTEEARREMERSDNLYTGGFISKETFEQAVTAYHTSEADFKASRAKLVSARAQSRAAVSQLSLARADLKEAEATLSFNEAKLSDMIIKSPISGTVVFKELEKGETISPGMTVMTIIDLKNLYVRADIDETQIGSVGLNSDAVISIEKKAADVFKGKVAEIGRYAEFATQRDVGRGRQDIKTFRVKIAVENPEGLLKPGMTVLVKVPKKEPSHDIKK